MAGDYNLGTAQGRITIDASAASKAFDVVKQGASILGDAVRDKVQSVQDLGYKMVAVGAAGVTGFGIAVNAASKFESGLSAVAAVSGATVQEMDAIREAALRIGKDTSFSATEAASAMEELVKAGISVEDVLNGAADATVALAAAGGVSLPVAAGLAANAMNQFNLSAQDLPRVADLIAGAANASAIDVGEFGSSLSQVGAVANLAGISFDDTAVAIAELGNAGIKGSDAGTSLKTMFTNLIPTTKDQQAEFVRLGLSTFSVENGMKALADRGLKPVGSTTESITGQLKKYAAEQAGVKEGSAGAEDAFRKLAIQTGFLDNQFFDAQGNTKGLADVQQILKDATSGMTQEQKLASLELLFGSDAIRAAAIMTEQGSKGFTDLAASMGKVTAADVARTRLDNLSGSVEQLKGTLETAQIIIGNVIIPIIRRFVDALTFLVNIFNNLPGPIQTAIGVIAGVITVISLVVGGVLVLITAFGGLIASFLLSTLVLGPLRSVLIVLIRTLISTGSIVTAVTAAYARFIVVLNTMISRSLLFAKVVRGLYAAFLFLTSPIGIIIIALIALGVILYKTFEPFRSFIDGIVDVLQNKFAQAINFVKDAYETFIMILKGGDYGAPEGAMGLIANAAYALKDAIDFVVAAYNEFKRALLTGLTDGGSLSLVAKAGLALRETFFVLRAAYETFKNALLAGGGEQLSGVFGFIADAGIRLREVFFAIRDGYNDFKRAISTGLTDAGPLSTMATVGLALREVFFNLKAAYDVFKNALLGGEGAQLVGVFGAVADAGIVLRNAFFTLRDAIGTALAAIGPVVVQVGTAMINAFMMIWGVIVTQLVPALVNLYTTLATTIFPIIMTVVGAIIQFGMAIAPVVFEILKVVAIIAGVFLAVLFQLVVFLIGTVIPAILQVAGPVIAALVTAFGFVITWIIQLISWFVQFVTYLIGVFGPSVLALAGIFTAIMTLIGQIVNIGWNFIKSIFQSALGALRGLIDVFVGFFTGDWGRMWDGIKQIGQAGWNTIKALFSAAVGILSGLLQALMSTLLSLWNAGWGRITGAIGGFMGQINSAVQSGLNTAVQFFSSLPGRILGAVGNLGGLLMSAGRQVIDGLIAGIQSGIGRVKDLLNSVTGLIPDWKGPMEVDAKLLTPNGEAIMGSLMDGLGNQIKPLQNMLSGITMDIPSMVKIGPSPSLAGVAPVRTRDSSRTVSQDNRIMVEVEAPQNMSPDEVGIQVARRVGYSVLSRTRPPASPVGVF